MKITEQCVVGLSWTLKDTLGEVLDETQEPIEFLVGGDDLLLICRAEMALDLALNLVQELKKYKLADGDPLDVPVRRSRGECVGCAAVGGANVDAKSVLCGAIDA